MPSVPAHVALATKKLPSVMSVRWPASLSTPLYPAPFTLKSSADNAWSGGVLHRPRSWFPVLGLVDWQWHRGLILCIASLSSLSIFPVCGRCMSMEYVQMRLTPSRMHPWLPLLCRNDTPTPVHGDSVQSPVELGYTRALRIPAFLVSRRFVQLPVHHYQSDEGTVTLYRNAVVFLPRGSCWFRILQCKHPARHVPATEWKVSMIFAFSTEPSYTYARQYDQSRGQGVAWREWRRGSGEEVQF